MEASIRHQFDQGIDAMIVADNGSTDGTLGVLDRLATELPLYVGHDSLAAYHQAAKMTYLATAAHRAGG